MDIEGLIEQLQRLGESEHIEAKSASTIGHSIMETICAFANEPDLGGGYLLLGIQKHEDTSSYHIVGVHNVEKIIEDLVSQCRTIFNMPVHIDIKQQSFDGKNIIGVFVPEMQNGSKPIYFQKQGLPKGAYRRLGSSDVQCTEDDLCILYQNRHHESFDYTALPDADWTDIDEIEIDVYKNERAAVQPNAPELQWSNQELLQALGCAKKINQQFKPTIAGVLLFGTQTALRRLFPTIRLDYIRESGKYWISDPENRYVAVEIRGPLMNIIRRALATIMDDLPKAFSLPEGSIQRQDIPVLPFTVIREAVVNAVMHRDYRIPQAIQMIRYSNRLEIRNPGYSLIAEEHLGEPGSRSRNPKISEVLHETHFAEAKGSGIRIMREAMQKAGLSSPLFESDRKKNSFTSTFLFHYFLGKDDLLWLSKFKEYQLTNDQTKALIFTRELGAINNAAYRTLNHVDTLTASVSLRQLRDIGLLVAKNQSSATYYVPGEIMLRDINIEGKEHRVEGKEHRVEGKEHRVNTKIVAPPMPPPLQNTLNALGKKAPPSQVRELITRLCVWKEMTASELAHYLNRDKKRLVRIFLTPMVLEGILAYKHPEMPDHPNQAYRKA